MNLKNRVRLLEISIVIVALIAISSAGIAINQINKSLIGSLDTYDGLRLAIDDIDKHLAENTYKRQLDFESDVRTWFLLNPENNYTFFNYLDFAMANDCGRKPSYWWLLNETMQLDFTHNVGERSMVVNSTDITFVIDGMIVNETEWCKGGETIL